MRKIYLVAILMGVIWGCGGIREGWGDSSGMDGSANGYDGAELAPDGMPDPPLPDGGDQGRPEVPLQELDFVGSEGCGEVQFHIARVIPDVLILLDRSHSMSFTPPTPPLWDTIRQAITVVTAAMDDSIWFGLMSFPNSVPPGECTSSANQCAPASAVLVPVGPNTATEIELALMSLTTCGGTPMALSLQSSYNYLATLANGHPKYIILATDGAPNCNDALDGDTCRCTYTNCPIANQNCLDDVRTYAVLDSLCAAGVRTYILGMGEATAIEWSDVLAGLALHGCTENYYAAQDPAAIQTALEEIAGVVASCRFEMNCADIPDSTLVNFYFDGEVVQRDPNRAAGWDWVDPCDSTTDESGSVEFFGTFCNAILSSGVSTVSAKFGCPTILI